MKKIKSALISVYDKAGLETLAQTLADQNVVMYSTGGTEEFLLQLGHRVVKVEQLTGYPSILGGRVKTLHPKVFGGILARRNETNDLAELENYEIPEIDLVIVDLYPFEATLASGASHQAIIEKIDIGGISLIRAAGKNYNDTAIIASKDDYQIVNDWLLNQSGCLTDDNRK